MRLIDADHLRRWILSRVFKTQLSVADVIDQIDREDTIEPEQKKGEWIPDNRPGGGFWVCSCCKFPSEAFAANKLYKYCPVCGADMRGEQ